jgi:hypothetical protein
MSLYLKQSSSVLHVNTQSEPCITLPTEILVSSLDRNEVSYFGQSIHNHPYGIISFRGARQPDNEVHLFPLPFGYL